MLKITAQPVSFYLYENSPSDYNRSKIWPIAFREITRMLKESTFWLNFFYLPTKASSTLEPTQQI